MILAKEMFNIQTGKVFFSPFVDRNRFYKTAKLWENHTKILSSDYIQGNVRKLKHLHNCVYNVEKSTVIATFAGACTHRACNLLLCVSVCVCVADQRFVNCLSGRKVQNVWHNLGTTP